MEQVPIGVALIAGIISFLSPCVLPLVPGYISFLSGLSLDELKQGSERKEIVKKAGLRSIAFVIGFSCIFTVLGASASFIGALLAEHIRILAKIAGILIVVLGLHLMGAIRIKWLNYEKRVSVKKSASGFFSAFLIGVAFAFGWTPCIGPILAGILALAAAQEIVMQGVFLLSVYSLGLGIPFIITGFAIGVFMHFFQRYKRFIHAGEIVAGVLLVGIGILIFFDSLAVLIQYLPDFFYKFLR